MDGKPGMNHAPGVRLQRSARHRTRGADAIPKRRRQQRQLESLQHLCVFMCRGKPYTARLVAREYPVHLRVCWGAFVYADAQMRTCGSECAHETQCASTLMTCLRCPRSDSDPRMWRFLDR
jgi:hypothetical protein